MDPIPVRYRLKLLDQFGAAQRANGLEARVEAGQDRQREFRDLVGGIGRHANAHVQLSRLESIELALGRDVEGEAGIDTEAKVRTARLDFLDKDARSAITGVGSLRPLV